MNAVLKRDVTSYLGGLERIWLDAVRASTLSRHLATRVAHRPNFQYGTMAFIAPSKAFELYVDLEFNAWLIFILFIAYLCTLRSKSLLLLIVLAASAAILTFDTTSTVGGLIKIMCELPLGLGSVLAYQTASKPFQARHLSAFTTYVNVAVYGNIGMMVATPIGGTFRGVFARVACIALFVWIVQQGYRARWKTVVLDDRFFVFTAASKSWIFAHAVYRLVLLTLPCFKNGPRYRLLELFSLGLTLALSLNSGLPFEHCFGQADTLTVPAISGWSAIATTFDLLPRDASKGTEISNSFDAHLDVLMSAVLSVVIIFICYKITTHPNQHSAKNRTDRIPSFTKVH